MSFFGKPKIIRLGPTLCWIYHLYFTRQDVPSKNFLLILKTRIWHHVANDVIYHLIKQRQSTMATIQGTWRQIVEANDI